MKKINVIAWVSLGNLSLSSSWRWHENFQITFNLKSKLKKSKMGKLLPFYEQ